MEKLLSKETISTLLKLGVYQIVGGGIGVLMILWGMFQTMAFNAPLLILYTGVLALFGYSIFCGISCVQTKKKALTYSLYNQILQVIGFTFTDFSFKYVAGVHFSIGFEMRDAMHINFNPGISSVIFNINMGQEYLSLSINLIAIALIFWINKIMKRVKSETERWDTPVSDFQ